MKKRKARQASQTMRTVWIRSSVWGTSLQIRDFAKIFANNRRLIKMNASRCVNLLSEKRIFVLAIKNVHLDVLALNSSASTIHTESRFTGRNLFWIYLIILFLEKLCRILNQWIPNHHLYKERRIFVLPIKPGSNIFITRFFCFIIWYDISTFVTRISKWQGLSEH